MNAPESRPSLASLVSRLALGAFVAGCASAPLPPARPPAGDGAPLSGRIAVAVEADATAPARALNAAFELEGSAAAGRLALATPLGSMVAQARWSAAGATLVTPQGAAPFPDLDALAREMLGEAVPVGALFDWLRGRPWPGAPAATLAPPAVGFAQLGWDVDLARLADSVVVARRAAPPGVSVRARLDPH